MNDVLYRAVCTIAISSMLLISSFSTEIYAQNVRGEYKLSPYPDAWFNQVDGFRVGLRLLGEYEGTFKDGPHRIDAGIWLATKLPEQPVSYYVSLTEPLFGPYLPGNEFNIRFLSSIRTGFSIHGVEFSKRWQQGISEYDYFKITSGFHAEKLIAEEYRWYPFLWTKEWVYLYNVQLTHSREFESGRLINRFNIGADANIDVDDIQFASLDSRFKHRLNDFFSLNMRFYGFFGASTLQNTQYGIRIADATPREWMNQGISRAYGTLPVQWMENGDISIAGGMNLRGYADMKQLLFNKALSLNTEIDIKNPITELFDEGITGDFIDLRSYVFFDVGSAKNQNETLSRSNSGLGLQFSINIPDYLGNNRGFALRYEVPLWLSHPEKNENNFKLRHHIGIGAVVYF